MPKPPIRTATPASKWQPGKVPFETDNGAHIQPDGKVWEVFGITPWNVGGEAGFYLIHGPTQALICWVWHEADAMAVADFLWNVVADAMRLETKEDVQAASPPWLRPWIKAVRQKCKWVDPVPFVEKQ